MSPPVSTVDSRLPRYHRLRDQIAGDIAAQRWRPGDAIPTEAELATVHGVAIGTVRKAVDMLVADGVVERIQGRGTYIRRPDFGNAFLRFLRRHRGAGDETIPASRLLLREAVTGPAIVCQHLGLAVGAVVIHLQRLRLVDDKPVMAENIWLDRRRFAPILTLSEDDIGPLLYPAYERWCGQTVASAQEALTVGVADAEDASLLGLPEGAPVVVIERRAVGYDGGCLEWRTTRAPAADFRYQIDIR